MQQTSIYRYFAFGFNYSLISTDGLLGHKGKDAIPLIDEFLRDLASLELVVTQAIASDLLDQRSKIEKAGEATVSKEIAEAIQKITERLDPALDAELQLRHAYVLTKKRYALDSLLKDPEQLFADGAYGTLSDTAKRDYRLACMQIALSQPTAAAFHLMRSLEEQVKNLYFSFKKTNRLDKPMWGPMTQELRKKRAPKPSEKLLNHLDGMRIHFRNPTQHPESFYTMDEAQDLLNQTIAAINMIASEFPAAK